MIFFFSANMNMNIILKEYSRVYLNVSIIATLWLKSKLQPNPANFGHNNFFTNSPIFHNLLQKPPTGLKRTVWTKSFRKSIKNLTSMSHTTTLCLSLFIDSNSHHNDFQNYQGFLKQPSFLHYLTFPTGRLGLLFCSSAGINLMQELQV